MEKSIVVAIVAVVLFTTILLVPPTTTGFAALGENCAEDTDCDEGSCIDLLCTDNSSCNSNDDCETGYSCSDDLACEEDEEEEETVTIVYDPITLELSADKVAVDTNVQGTLTLYLEELLDPTEELTITVDDTEYIYEIEEVLLDSNYSIEYEDVSFEAEDGEDEKNLNLTADETAYLGFKIPRYSDISDISFTVSASKVDNSSPSAVFIDLGNEGDVIDWFYLGDLIDYLPNALVSPDLDETADSTAQISDSETYYCEYIDLPLTKHIVVEAEYEKLGSTGDLYATILSVPTGDPEYGRDGGADICDLPESGTSGSCEIELSYSIEGEYLVCIYTTEESEGDSCESSGDCNEGSCKDAVCHNNLYDIRSDSPTETNTGYTCPTSASGYCSSTDFVNFFISAYTGNYSSEMDGDIDLETWQTFDNSLLTAAKYYVGSEPYSGICKTDVCTVPLAITSETDGALTLGDLSVTYSYGDVTQDAATWYNLEIPQADIDEIESDDLEDGVEVEINLDLLDIALDELGDYTMTAEFLGEEAEASFSVLDAADILDGETLIKKAIATLEALLNEDEDEYFVLEMMDKVQKVEQTLDNLESLELQIGFIDEDELLENAEDLLENVPWEISFSATESDTYTLAASDIPDELGDTNEIYNIQEAVSIVGTQRNVDVETYNGDISSYTFIKKDITAEETIDGTVYEIAPVSLDDIAYTPRPSSTESDTATYSISLNSGESDSHYFLSEDTLAIEDFITIYVEEEEELECEEDSDCSSGEICEDNECVEEEVEEEVLEEESSILFYLIPVVVLLLVLALVLLYFWKKQGKKKSRGNNPLALVITQMKKKGLKKDQIVSLLKKKGWDDHTISEGLK